MLSNQEITIQQYNCVLIFEIYIKIQKKLVKLGFFIVLIRGTIFLICHKGTQYSSRLQSMIVFTRKLLFLQVRDFYIIASF